MAFRGPLEDRIAIRELIESYATAVTRRDSEEWASLWDEEARWAMPDLGVELKGRQTIASSWIEMMAQYHGPADAPWPFLFVSIPASIAVDGDRAEVASHTIEAYQDASGETVHLKSEYRDVVVRRQGRWLFLERAWRLMPLDDHRKLTGQ
jgi:uncharacterized protein (TIGR02246 family)